MAGSSLTVYALLDCPSVPGAYRFEITPGASQPGSGGPSLEPHNWDPFSARGSLQPQMVDRPMDMVRKERGQACRPPHTIFRTCSMRVRNPAVVSTPGEKRGSKNSSLTGRALTAAMSALIWSSDPVKIHRSAPCGCGVR